MRPWFHAGVVCAGLAQPSMARAFELGVGLGVRSDLDDSSSGDAHLRFGAGPILKVPARLELGEGVYWKAQVNLGMNPGQDRVEWKRFDGEVTVYSDDHWTLLSSASLMTGPELSVVDSPSIRLLWGVGGGLVDAQIWHSFDSSAVEIFDLEQNDLDNSRNIDPYTHQLAPIVGTHASLAIWRGSSLAFELEAGYNISFLREVSLRKASEEVEAVRSAMGLNLFHLGLSVVRVRESGAEQ